jgi:histidine triad (HIT) family protein
MADDCIFCKVLAGEIPAEVVHRADGFLAFRDIAPKAPTHILVIPTRHVVSMSDVGGLTDEERSDMLLFIADVARMAGLEEGGYRITANHGPDAHQSVFHLHWHVMGGASLSQSM